jgi:hypothetical protein
MRFFIRSSVAGLAFPVLLNCLGVELDAQAQTYDRWRRNQGSPNCGTAPEPAASSLGAATAEQLCAQYFSLLTPSVPPGACTPAGVSYFPPAEGETRPHSALCLYTADWETQPPPRAFLLNALDELKCASNQEFHAKFGACCPRGQGYDPATSQCTASNLPKQAAIPPCKESCVANPITLGIANKFQVEEDYSAFGPMPLRLIRYYNSRIQPATDWSFGSAWSHWYQRRILVQPSVPETAADAFRHDGKVLRYFLSPSGVPRHPICAIGVR